MNEIAEIRKLARCIDFHQAACPPNRSESCKENETCVECWTSAIIALIERREKPMVEALKEAKLQIEYLHDKFNETGSGNSALAKIDAALKEER